MHRSRATPFRLLESLVYILGINIPDTLKHLGGTAVRTAGNKIIVLGTQYSLRLVSEADYCWHMDGMFEVVLSIMTQLFSIHGRIKRPIVQMVYCLIRALRQNRPTENVMSNGLRFKHRFETLLNYDYFKTRIASAATEFFQRPNMKDSLSIDCPLLKSE